MGARALVTSRTLVPSRDGAFLRFGGVTGKVAAGTSFSAPTSTTPITLSAWTRLGSAGVNTATSLPVISYFFQRLYFRETLNRIRIRFDEAVAHEAADTSVTTVPGIWYHVVGVYNPTGGANTTMTIFKNGTLATTANNTVLPTTNQGSVNLVGGGGDGFYGDIYDVRIYHYAFGTAEVDNLYTNGVNPVTPQISYLLKDGSGTIAQDNSGNNIPGNLSGNTTWLPQARSLAVRSLV